MIDKGDSYEKMKAKYPLRSEDEYKEFKIKCQSPATSESSQWRKEMRELNLGEHKLGPGGYRVAEPIWDKEDAERAEQGLPPRFEKYSGDKQTRNYVRARYKEDPITKELTTDPKTRALELELLVLIFAHQRIFRLDLLITITFINHSLHRASPSRQGRAHLREGGIVHFIP